MKETQYLLATPQDREEIVDFANFVFSQAHEPHDFKKLLPKAYADNAPDFSDWHFLAKQNGRIRAMVACRPLEMNMLDKKLSCGFIGTVSVHPYSRGEGHMKHLMKMAMDNARERGHDLMILGGQRQRYNYFGFEHMGVSLHYGVNTTNLRHVLRDTDVSHITFSVLTEDKPEEVDYCWNLSNSMPVHGTRPREEYLNIMHSWNAECYVVRVSGEMKGYVMTAGEIALEDEQMLPLVLKAYLQFMNQNEIELHCAPYQKERIHILSRLCEYRSIGTFEMIHILNYPKVVDTLLSLKASYMRLEDGVFTLKVDEQTPFTIRVKDNKVSVAEEGLEPDAALTHLEAQRLLMDLESALCESRMPLGWLPLPFTMTAADTF
ncbi:MAG: GNAT family N-acetyltransferase [Clostridia bacterium]|nr:GNAT family N-acetyltransferase [Clostridia bacterium]